jgi:hypothetical protein
MLLFFLLFFLPPPFFLLVVREAGPCPGQFQTWTSNLKISTGQGEGYRGREGERERGRGKKGERGRGGEVERERGRGGEEGGILTKQIVMEKGGGRGEK